MKVENWVKNFGYYDYDNKWVNPRKRKEIESCKELYLMTSGSSFSTPIPEIEIPEEIIDFQRLSKMNISCNQLKESGRLSGLENLTHLELYNLETVPAEIFELKTVELLILKNCIEFEPLPLNERLKKLFLYSNDKDLVIPSKIDSFINLELLNIDYQNPKQKIGFDMGKMKSLKVLQIGCKSYYEQTGKLLENHFENLEEELHKLSSLEELELIGIQIPSIFEIIVKNTNLKRVKLTGCGVTENPEVIKEMEFLDKIEIG